MSFFESIKDPSNLFNSVDKDLVANTTLKILREEAKWYKKYAHSKHYPVYGVRLKNKASASRLLFTPIGTSLVLLDYVDNHAYLKSVLNNDTKFAQVKVRIEQTEAISVANFCERYQDNLQSDKQINFRDETEIEVEYYPIYQNKYLSLTGLQNEAIHADMPLIVSGVAGSGKSCVAFLLLKQQVEQLSKLSQQYPEATFRVLLTCKSPQLANMFKREWANLNLNTGVEVNILSYKELYEKELSKIAESGAAPACEADENTYLNWAKKERKINEEEALKQYREIQLRAGRTTIEYKQLGEKRSRFTLEEKEKIETLYVAYKKYLMNINQVDLTLELEDKKNSFHVIIVDEAQDLSFSQWKNLLHLSINEHICLFTDSNQCLENVLCGVDSNHMQHELSTKSDFKVVTLQNSHRNPQSIAKAATQILGLKNALIGGVVSKGQPLTHEAAPSVDVDEESQVFGMQNYRHHPQVDQIKKLAAQPDTLILIGDDKKRQDAKDFFNSPLVFTVPEAKGLEFNNVIFFKMLDNPNIEQVSKILNQHAYKEEIKLISNLPKNRGLLFEREELIKEMNKLYVGITRAAKQVIFCEKSIAGKKANVDFFLQHLVPDSSQTNLALQQGSQEDIKAQWENVHEILRENGNLEQAQAVYTTCLTSEEDRKKVQMLDKFIQDYETKLKVEEEKQLKKRKRKAQEEEGTISRNFKNKLIQHLKSFKDDQIHLLIDHSDPQLRNKLIKLLAVQDFLIRTIREQNVNASAQLIFFLVPSFSDLKNLLFLSNKLEELPELIKKHYKIVKPFQKELQYLTDILNNQTLLFHLLLTRSGGKFLSELFKTKGNAATKKALYTVYKETDTSALFYVTYTQIGMEILTEHSELLLEAPDETLFTWTKSDEISVFFLLVATPEGRAFLKANPELLLRLNVETLCALRKKDNRSLLFCLAEEESLPNLKVLDAKLLANLPLEIWCARSNDDHNSALQWLLSDENGADFLGELLKFNPEFLSRLPSKEWSILSTNDNTSLLFWLVSTQTGRNIVIELVNKDKIFALTLEDLMVSDDGRMVIELLCNYQKREEIFPSIKKNEYTKVKLENDFDEEIRKKLIFTATKFNLPKILKHLTYKETNNIEKEEEKISILPAEIAKVMGHPDLAEKIENYVSKMKSNNPDFPNHFFKKNKSVDEDKGIPSKMATL